MFYLYSGKWDKFDELDMVFPQPCLWHTEHYYLSGDQVCTALIPLWKKTNISIVQIKSQIDGPEELLIKEEYLVIILG